MPETRSRTRREFLSAATTALGVVSSVGATAQALVQRSGRSTASAALTGADFSYVGCFRCPPYAFYPSPVLRNNTAANTAYSYYAPGSAPLASRVVEGERRFFIVGHGSGMNQVIEIALPDRLSMVVESAPIAQTRDYWARGGVYGPANIRRFSRTWPTGGAEVRTYGLLWDEDREVLWWSIGEVGQNQATGSPCLGYAKLTTPTGSENPPAAAEAFGPWDLDATVSNHTAKGMIIELPTDVRPFVGNRRLAMGGAHFHSILGPHDFGPAVIAVDEPGDSTPPMRPGGGPPWNRDRRTLSYANVLRYGTGTPGSRDARGRFEYLQRAHRPPDYSLLGVREPFPAVAAGGTTVNPAQGVGWWTHLDVTHGAVWIKTATKQGLVFTGGLCSGRTWYTTTGYLPPGWRPGDAGFGEAVPAMFDYGERTRIGAEFYHPAFFVLALEDLVTGATRGYGHYQQEVTVIRHPKQAPHATREGTVAWPFGAPVYDAAARRLYVIQAPGWRLGEESHPLIHCWEVSD